MVNRGVEPLDPRQDIAGRVDVPALARRLAAARAPAAAAYQAGVDWALAQIDTLPAWVFEKLAEHGWSVELFDATAPSLHGAQQHFAGLRALRQQSAAPERVVAGARDALQAAWHAANAQLAQEAAAGRSPA